MQQSSLQESSCSRAVYRSFHTAEQRTAEQLTRVFLQQSSAEQCSFIRQVESEYSYKRAFIVVCSYSRVVYWSIYTAKHRTGVFIYQSSYCRVFIQQSSVQKCLCIRAVITECSYYRAVNRSVHTSRQLQQCVHVAAEQFTGKHRTGVFIYQSSYCRVFIQKSRLQECSYIMQRSYCRVLTNCHRRLLTWKGNNIKVFHRKRKSVFIPQRE